MTTKTETQHELLIAQHNAHSHRKAIADTGATGNFIAVTDRHVVHNLVPHNGTSVYLPDGTAIQSSHAGTLALCNRTLPALIFPKLNCGSLISVGSLCDTNLHVTFTPTDMKVVDPDTGHVVATGSRDTVTRLWYLLLDTSTTTPTPPAPMTHTAANVLEFRNVPQIIAFWKAAFGSPTDDTLIKAVDHNFINIPGLTSKRLRKYPSHSKATARGHLDQHRKGYRSTKSPPPSHPIERPPPSSGHTYAKVVEMTNTNARDNPVSLSTIMTPGVSGKVRIAYRMHF
jgi:hypothetical protein